MAAARITKISCPRYRKFLDRTYRKALPYLLKDFDNRCAYSHVSQASQVDTFHVDHFDPSGRNRQRNRYSNLRPACGYVNIRKSNTMIRNTLDPGIPRILDCRREHEYKDGHITENLETGELIGHTPAGRFHIEVLDLNSPRLVDLRKLRTRLRKFLHSPSAFCKDASFEQIQESLSTLRKAIEDGIPTLDEL